MKKIWTVTLAALAACTMIPSGNLIARADEFPAPACKAAYLADAETGEAVYSKEETKRLPIASMCKIMTLLLCFEAEEQGVYSPDELITVSESAAGMGGSQVFLQAGLSYPAKSLVKTVAVCSANDSCVALAERIAGSESAFVAKMNARAKELGADNTLFSNCTGLPKDPQYSCARDVSLMFRELIRHRQYFENSRIWLEDFPHPDGRTTSITNTNRLIRSYNGCDGGKTGFTGEAGFCLAATAKRGETRLVSVVIGAADSKSRFDGTAAMLDYAFNVYETRVVLQADEPLTETVKVKGGKKSEIAVQASAPLTVFSKRGETVDYRIEYDLPEVKAPIRKGKELGRATLFIGGIEKGSCALIAAEDVPKMTWWDAYRETARNWQ